MTLVALDLNATRVRAATGTGAADSRPLALDGKQPELPMALFSTDTSSQLERAAQASGIRAVFSKTQWTQLFRWLEVVLGSLPPTQERARVPQAA